MVLYLFSRYMPPGRGQEQIYVTEPPPKVGTDFMCILICMSAFELLNWNRIANLIVNCGSERKSFGRS